MDAEFIEKTEMEKTDRRVMRTKRAIRNAFVKLLAEKEFDDITVKELAALANVNRKTVYNYYKGVYEILDEVESELVCALESVSDDLDYEKVLKNPLIIFEKLTEVLSRDLEFYGNLMRISRFSHVTERIGNFMRTRMYDSIMNSTEVKNKNPLYVGMFAEYITAGMTAAYRVWFNSSRTQSLEDFSKNMGKMILYGVMGAESASAAKSDFVLPNELEKLTAK